MTDSALEATPRLVADALVVRRELHRHVAHALAQLERRPARASYEIHPHGVLRLAVERRRGVVREDCLEQPPPVRRDLRLDLAREIGPEPERLAEDLPLARCQAHGSAAVLGANEGGRTRARESRALDGHGLREFAPPLRAPEFAPRDHGLGRVLNRAGRPRDLRRRERRLRAARDADRAQERQIARASGDEPIVIVEVLSEATERYDRDGKFQCSTRIASLREYVLISQDEPRIEVFRRSDGWVGEVGARGMTVRIHGCSVDVDAIYAR
jgi:hypothetical protein